MTTFIEYNAGNVYDPSHLKPFDLALAKAGHPLAWYDGMEISHVFETEFTGFFIKIWRTDDWAIAGIRDEFITNIRLAPLAIKDGRPLHVGDWIEVEDSSGHWHKLKAWILEDSIVWRFADEVAG